MLSFSQYNKLYPNGHKNPLMEENKGRKTNRDNKKNNTDTIIPTGDFIEFLQNVDYQRVWIKDDGDWYRFKFVDVVKEQTKKSTPP